MTGQTNVRGTFLECGSVFPETGDHCFARGDHDIHESEHLYYRWRDDGELVPTPHFSTPEFAALRREALGRRLRQLAGQKEQALVRAAVAATLHTVAEWGMAFPPTPDESTRVELHAIADQVEALHPNDGWCCPVCEEVTCDEDCPLAGVRGKSP